jgi:hypothetical protein
MVNAIPQQIVQTTRRTARDILIIVSQI